MDIILGEGVFSILTFNKDEITVISPQGHKLRTDVNRIIKLLKYKNTKKVF